MKLENNSANPNSVKKRLPIKPRYVCLKVAMTATVSLSGGGDGSPSETKAALNCVLGPSPPQAGRDVSQIREYSIQETQSLPSKRQRRDNQGETKKERRSSVEVGTCRSPYHTTMTIVT